MLNSTKPIINPNTTTFPDEKTTLRLKPSNHKETTTFNDFTIDLCQAEDFNTIVKEEAIKEKIEAPSDPVPEQSSQKDHAKKLMDLFLGYTDEPFSSYTPPPTMQSDSFKVNQSPFGMNQDLMNMYSNPYMQNSQNSSLPGSNNNNNMGNPLKAMLDMHNFYSKLQNLMSQTPGDSFGMLQKMLQKPS